MNVQLHTDRNFVIDAELAARIETNVAADLERFSSRVTRVDLHLTDQSAGRKTGAHVRCLAEAQVAGHPPVVVAHEAPEAKEAIDGAVVELVSALGHTVERLVDKDLRETIRRP
jgi:Sigma 54 modulation protein / S30EA ribosomal protein